MSACNIPSDQRNNLLTRFPKVAITLLSHGQKEILVTVWSSAEIACGQANEEIKKHFT